MSKSLLHKTQGVYIKYFVVLIMIAAPSFYFLTQWIYLDSIDESLVFEKKQFINVHLPELKIKDVPEWNRFNANIQLLEYSDVHDEIKNSYYFNKFEKEEEQFRELTSPISIENKKYQLSIKTNMIEAEDLIFTIALLFLGLFFSLLITFYFITKRMSRKIWSPFFATLEQLEQFEIDQDSIIELSVTNITEFEKLNASLKILIDHNKSIFRSQREFIENAAHELQTPIAVLQSKIDVLLQQENLTEKQIKIYSDISESLFSFSRLNKNLLLLSRVNKESEISKEDVSVNDLVSDQIEFFTEQAKSKNITIQFNELNKVTVHTSKAFMEVLVSNLLLNTIKHNTENGSITVDINERYIRFHNTGVSHPLDEDQLYERFAKQGSERSGNGLGLSIVRRIVSLNNWKIDYTFKSNEHIFTIWF